MKEFNGYWDSEKKENAHLADINLTIKKGEFVGITGAVGSGKSGLLGAILGEIPFYSGEISKKGTIGYVEQEPFILSATVKENILFGREFDADKYAAALEDSCLVRDLVIFEDGENTKIGEKGATLSGGQKARLSLARSLYSDPDILLFDDPLSAVDSKVGREIF